MATPAPVSHEANNSHERKENPGRNVWIMTAYAISALAVLLIVSFYIATSAVR
jgi:hypothetical protein